ncbi:MAG: hypothetical protein HW403_1277 [Dehalococcoidia bacterium]|nr:hypothetical protein [Dehalococcoidia bacterium]
MRVVSGKSVAMAAITVALLAFLVLMGYGLVRAGSGDRPAGVVINEEGRLAATRLKEAPDITLPLLDGGSFRFGEYRGQVVVDTNSTKAEGWCFWGLPCGTKRRMRVSSFKSSASPILTASMPEGNWALSTG